MSDASTTRADSALPQNSASGPPASSAPVQKIVIQQGGALAGRLAWLVWTAVLVSGFFAYQYWASRQQYYDTTGGISEHYHSGDKTSEDKIAVIRLEGVILEGDGFVKRQIDRVREDENVKAIVLRVDSPGGTVTASDYIYHHLRKLREEKNVPLVVSMGSIAASGGYYAAMAVGDQPECIYAEPTTWTGSIGVIIPNYDVAGLLERFDVKEDSITSHPRKQMLRPGRRLSEEDRAVLQRLVNVAFDDFKQAVRFGRPSLADDDAALDRLATGEVFTASDAKQFGLVDEIGFIEEAVERAAEMAQLDPQKVRVVRFKRPASLIEFAGIAQASPGSLNLATLLELSSPRAYYLSTTLPPLIRAGEVVSAARER